ncbi:MAG: DUF4125 family protein [Oscillospiraceae bacterium]|nr:DUF4125 family protein [Oscillospiraceae bacterium]
MTLYEKKEALIKEEWDNFHTVQNEGGMAGCQQDPETFFAMRRSQFTCWNEALVDSWHNDLLEAKSQGRNLLSEKYAWMMQQTAPDEFKKISHLLCPPDVFDLELMEQIIADEVRWMEQYHRDYPFMAAGNRSVHSSSDSRYETSFETYLRGELHTYSPKTLRLYADMINRLKKEHKSLAVCVMDAMVKSYGYKDLDDAENQQKLRATYNI